MIDVDGVVKGSEIMYVYKNTTFLTPPEGHRYEVIKYMYDSERNITFGYLNKVSYLSCIVVAVILVILMIFVVVTPSKEHVVQHSNTIHIINGDVGLNIKNYEKNEYTIKVSLAYRSATLVENINISPGDSVGYVYSQESEKLKKGYYMCVLKYELLDTVVPLVKEYEVLVVVE